MVIKDGVEEGSYRREGMGRQGHVKVDWNIHSKLTFLVFSLLY